MHHAAAAAVHVSVVVGAFFASFKPFANGTVK